MKTKAKKSPTPSPEPSAAPVEHRAFTVADFSIRAAHDADNSPGTLVGYAAIFDSLTDLGWFKESIRDGAFSKSIKDGDDVRALADHDASVNQLLGRRSAKTLRIEEDAKGLRVEIDLPDTETARNIVTQINAGNLNGMSFGFRPRVTEWNDEAEPPVRTLVDVELIEVSAVVFPAYQDTELAKRSYQHHRHEADPAPAAPVSKPSPEILRLRHKQYNQNKNFNSKN